MKDNNQKAWDKIDAILDEIARLQSEIGVPVHDPADREAFDTVARIERKILRKGVKRK